MNNQQRAESASSAQRHTDLFHGSPVILSFDINEILQLLQVGLIKNEMPGLAVAREGSGSDDAGVRVVLAYDAQGRHAYLTKIRRDKKRNTLKQGPDLQPVQFRQNPAGKNRILDALDRRSHFENGVNCGFSFELMVEDVLEVIQGAYRFFVIEIYEEAIRYYGAGIPGDLIFKCAK